MSKNKLIFLPFVALVFCFGNCKKTPVQQTEQIQATAWHTSANGSVLLQQQNNPVLFNGIGNDVDPTINVDTVTTYQTIDGFGYTLTGGSAELIHQMDAPARNNLLHELFGNGSNAIGVSYLRISIGASDLSREVFSYDDMPAGQTDVSLNHFNLAQDTQHLIPVLQEIMAINPTIKILGSPWSAPVWMKDNGSSIGGRLQSQYYAVYAQYFVKYIQAMNAKGINIDAITIQNEPENPLNNPSMVMTSAEQAAFIGQALGPAFQTAGIHTKIIIYDHNCDHPNYPIEVLSDNLSRPYIDGSAFHLYVGDISAMSSVRSAFPTKNIYFTEQWTGANGSFSGDLMWHMRNVIIGSMRNSAKTVLEWNLASDASYQPHTPGGCSECKGALTITGSWYGKNVAYYIIAQASKFVPSGSVRIASNWINELPNVAFKTPDGKKVLLVMNETTSSKNFNIKFNNQYAQTQIPASTVSVYVW